MEAFDGEDRTTLWEFWKDFIARNAINYVTNAWDEVSFHCYGVSGRKMWPESVAYMSGFQEETPENIQKKILSFGNHLGLELKPSVRNYPRGVQGLGESSLCRAHP